MTKLIYIFILLSNVGYSQDVVLDFNAIDPVKLSADFKLYHPNNQNQYIALQWSKGKLFYANGTSKTYDSLNFDRYGNKIEVVVNNKALSILPTGLFGGLIYDTETQGSLMLVVNIADQFRFLMVESNGMYILASYLISTAPPENLTYKLDEFRFEPKVKSKDVIREHYAIYKNGVWVGVKLSKSSLSKLFNVDKKELQLRAKTEGINTATKEGLIKLFQLINDN